MFARNITFHDSSDETRKIYPRCTQGEGENEVIYNENFGSEYEYLMDKSAEDITCVLQGYKNLVLSTE